jgi:NCAIR mutase (PurE)-related protein
VDHHRPLRGGVPEVVLGSAKTPADLVDIARAILEQGERLLVTRVDEQRLDALADAFPDAVHHERARAVTVQRGAAPVARTGVLICAAGTGDIPVAEEARVTAAWMGEAPETLYDVGVAGLHRLLAERERLERARVLVVVAGMEGALPSVGGGLVGGPVIAVPTSVGYGANLEGLAPLLAMMNACAPGVSVVNIDNGFGAGYMAALINRGAHAPE